MNIYNVLVAGVFFVGLTAPAVAGTGTCTAGNNGGTIDGGSCCQALTGSAAGCTCDESDASVNGVVSCTHIKIEDGKEVTLSVKGMGFKAPNQTPRQRSLSN